MKWHTTGYKPTHAASLPTVSDEVSDWRAILVSPVRRLRRVAATPPDNTAASSGPADTTSHWRRYLPLRDCELGSSTEANMDGIRLVRDPVVSNDHSGKLERKQQHAESVSNGLGLSL